MNSAAYVGGLVVVLAATALGGCAAQAADEDPERASEAALRDGINSRGCLRSPYNCVLHPGGQGQRVVHPDGGTTWAVDRSWLAVHGFVASGRSYLPVVDGNGESMGHSAKTELTLNYGQTRHMEGLTYVMALNAGVGAAGWVPIDAFADRAELRRRVGEVNALGEHLPKMACYHVAMGYDPRLDHLKVVRGATDAVSEEPDDYLPKKRANGAVYVNLAFSVPGDGLGAPAIDIFPAGTKFQRLDVATWESPGRPSLDVTLYEKPSGSSHYTRPAGAMKFLYGYVKTKDGHVRYGWMALDGLAVSSGCPDR
jgi:hypothetical protein